MRKAHLLTGEPRIGKTLTIKKLIDKIGKEYCGGFYLEEIRSNEERVGFQLVTLDGQHRTLAHVTSHSSIRVGRYGVNLDCLESLGIATIYQALTTKKLIILDEIGPMQLYSDRFKKMIIDVLYSSRPLLGTIAMQPEPWLDAIKQCDGVKLYTLEADNTNEIVESVLEHIKAVI